MIYLRYSFRDHTPDVPQDQQLVIEKTIPLNDINREIALLEAMPGTITTFDDGADDPTDPTEDRLNDLEEALELLLSGATE